MAEAEGERKDESMGGGEGMKGEDSAGTVVHAAAGGGGDVMLSSAAASKIGFFSGVCCCSASSGPPAVAKLTSFESVCGANCGVAGAAHLLLPAAPPRSILLCLPFCGVCELAAESGGNSSSEEEEGSDDMPGPKGLG